MSVLDVLTRDRVSIANRSAGCSVGDKGDALRVVSAMLASGQRGLDESRIRQVLVERERLQSTGVGGGVAVPHGSAPAEHLRLLARVLRLLRGEAFRQQLLGSGTAEDAHAAIVAAERGTP